MFNDNWDRLEARHRDRAIGGVDLGELRRCPDGVGFRRTREPRQVAEFRRSGDPVDSSATATHQVVAFIARSGGRVGRKKQKCPEVDHVGRVATSPTPLNALSSERVGVLAQWRCA